MNFTVEHIKVLEKHKEHWHSLQSVGFMRNIDKPVFDALQKVHNEAIQEVHYSRWCGECVADMVRNTYTQYDKFKLEAKTQKKNGK